VSRGLERLPLFVQLMALSAALMLVPGLHALATEHHLQARAFGYSAVLLAIVTALIGLATSARLPSESARSQLLALFAAYTVLPAILAVPFYEGQAVRGYFEAYFEMISALTTTGATLYDAPGLIDDSLHLWRGLVGWLGGFMSWVVAFAILAPLNLGGFEVVARGQGAGLRTGAPGGRPAETRGVASRVRRLAVRFAPVYGGATLALWGGQVALGETPFVAAVHAMSVLSTSGISPVGGLDAGLAGRAGEALLLVFYVFALTRLSFCWMVTADRPRDVLADPEMRVGLAVALLVPAVLMLRHWFGALDGGQEDLAAAGRAFWGALFTTVSFLTTTGFVSADWGATRGWSGLETPGTLLVGIALVGGGVATTAGGVKLLRVFALYRHGRRELDRLVHPSLVAGAGAGARRVPREGATIAWIFFMLFAVSVAATMLALAATGIDFARATVLAVAALSTTGPLAQFAGDAPISYAALPQPALAVLSAAMVLGRLETLALIALLNPEFWRR